MSAVDGIDEFAAKLAGILKEKNAAYGDSFARVPTILAGMYTDVPPETLEAILFNARIQDKLGRIAKDPLAAGEDAYLDLAGYALLMANVQRLRREGAQEPKVEAPVQKRFPKGASLLRIAEVLGVKNACRAIEHGEILMDGMTLLHIGVEPKPGVHSIVLRSDPTIGQERREWTIVVEEE